MLQYYHPVWYEIVLNLPPGTLESAAQVSKEWRELVNQLHGDKLIKFHQGVISHKDFRPNFTNITLDKITYNYYLSPEIKIRYYRMPIKIELPWGITPNGLVKKSDDQGDQLLLDIVIPNQFAQKLDQYVWTVANLFFLDDPQYHRLRPPHLLPSYLRENLQPNDNLRENLQPNYRPSITLQQIRQDPWWTSWAYKAYIGSFPTKLYQIHPPTGQRYLTSRFRVLKDQHHRVNQVLTQVYDHQYQPIPHHRVPDLIKPNTKLKIILSLESILNPYPKKFYLTTRIDQVLLSPNPNQRHRIPRRP